MTYPATITVPIAEDFCRGSYKAGSRYCLMGWVIEHFGPKDSKYWYSVPHAVRRKMLKVAGGEVAGFNDNPNRTDQDLADAYERFLVLMGYEVTP